MLIFVVQNNLQFTTINHNSYYIDKDTEVCAVQLNSTLLNICVLVIYISWRGKFKNFLTRLDTILQSLYIPKLSLVICCDINVNCLNDIDKKNQLGALLNSYNLFSTIDFPTRIYNDSSPASINIFIDITRINNCEVFPLINRLLNMTHK